MNGDIVIPEKDIDLERLGLINQDLFVVDGELAQRYNRVLKQVFEFDCDVDHFRVDKRGLSPELADFLKAKYPDRLEFGENYLNIGAANRFMVVVSPDQRSAPLVAPQSSYEEKLFDEVYRTARHTIEDLAASDALFGELENGITLFRTAEDLMQLRTVRVSLDTLGGTSQAVSELNRLSGELGEGNNALDPEYIEKMRQLVAKVGNVNARAVSDIFPIKTEVHCFYVEFYQGVHCLRNFKNEDGLRGIFISHHQGKPKDLGEEVIGLDLHDQKVLKHLHEYRFLRYNPDLIEQRIAEVEDDLLLAKGVDVVGLEPSRRKAKLRQYSQELPKSWHELSDIRRTLDNTSADVEDEVEGASYETRLKLSEAVSKKEIINHMLAELDPSDPMRVYQFNRRKFRTEFPTFPVNRQRYVAHSILTQMKGGSR
jgi:hypothetical protein